ncbi:hypothetical protein E4U51_000956 [Claviceps purpurea]|nr:hypothetical protein E4U51_000956 [Claviceps purpurea]
MATSILRRSGHMQAFCQVANRLAWKPLAFPIEGFAVIPADERIEEETLPNYATSQYYPVTIGEIFRARYQVVGKLGFGTTSTVWLARDLSERRHVALKLYIGSGSMVRSLDNEINAYKRIGNFSIKDPGRSAVRALLDSFHVDGPHGSHQCLVHPPLWDSVFGFRHRNPMRRFPGQIMIHGPCARAPFSGFGSFASRVPYRTHGHTGEQHAARSRRIRTQRIRARRAQQSLPEKGARGENRLSVA